MDETIRAPGGATVTSVLFACTYNAIRSPMAEALMKYFHGHRIYVDSVGVREGDPDPFMIAVMDEIGIDMTRHRCKTFDLLEDTSFDLVISLSPEAQHRAVEMTRTMACDVEFWNTLDPSMIDGNREARLTVYRQVRDILSAHIKKRFPIIGGPTV
jgi:protein-tyrosine-phosphatase